MNPPDQELRSARTTRVSRVVEADRGEIYRALVDPNLVAKWLPPGSMTCRVHEFEPDQAGMAGTMRVSWILTDVEGGVEVTSLCEDIPPGIRLEDNEAGSASSLAKLAHLLEWRE